jgi:DNA-binding response OmpR family regulator
MSLDDHKRRIFIAEDDAAIYELLVTRLNLAGYATLQARDGWDAFHGICDGKPDAVILDINLPGLDGFEVLRRLKARPSEARIPVLMLSARRAPDDVQTAIRLGARDYLSKPFNDVQLLQRVARLLRPPPPAPPPKDDTMLI